RKVLHTDPGFRAENLMTFSVRIPTAKYPKQENRQAFYRQAIERFRAMPGVTSASAANIIPLNGHQGNFFEVENGQSTRDKGQNPVTLMITAWSGYFETMGMSFLAGRGFLESEDQFDLPRVAVVNETFARYHWGTTDVVGKRLKYNGGSVWMQVVGVIRDIRHYGLDGVLRPSVMLPYTTNPTSGMTITIRGAISAESVLAAAREVLRQLGADLPMYSIMSMSERVDRSLRIRRAYSWLFAAFAAVAILLAAAGIYGVISFAVSQRTREIGIRMALGARPGQVMGGVLRNGMILVAIGLAIGIGASLLTARLLDTMLAGVSPRDAVTYAAVIAGVAAVGLLANYVPARRASRVDPMSVLRAE